MYYKLSAVFSGLLIAIMVTLNGTLSKGIGDYTSLMLIHLVGLLSISLILILKRSGVSIKEKIPVYLFSGGAISVFMIFFNNACVNNLGVSLTLALGLFGQLILSGIIDHFGLFGMDVHKFQKEKLVGFMVVFIGIVIMVVY